MTVPPNNEPSVIDFVKVFGRFVESGDPNTRNNVQIGDNEINNGGAIERVRVKGEGANGVGYEAPITLGPLGGPLGRKVPYEDPPLLPIVTEDISEEFEFVVGRRRSRSLSQDSTTIINVSFLRPPSLSVSKSGLAVAVASYSWETVESDATDSFRPRMTFAEFVEGDEDTDPSINFDGSGGVTGPYSRDAFVLDGDLLFAAKDGDSGKRTDGFGNVVDYIFRPFIERWEVPSSFRDEIYSGDELIDNNSGVHAFTEDQTPIWSIDREGAYLGGSNDDDDEDAESFFRTGISSKNFSVSKLKTGDYIATKDISNSEVRKVGRYELSTNPPSSKELFTGGISVSSSVSDNVDCNMITLSGGIMTVRYDGNEETVDLVAYPFLRVGGSDTTITEPDKAYDVANLPGVSSTADLILTRLTSDFGVEPLFMVVEKDTGRVLVIDTNYDQLNNSDVQSMTGEVLVDDTFSELITGDIETTVTPYANGFLVYGTQDGGIIQGVFLVDNQLQFSEINNMPEGFEITDARVSDGLIRATTDGDVWTMQQEDDNIDNPQDTVIGEAFNYFERTE